MCKCLITVIQRIVFLTSDEEITAYMCGFPGLGVPLFYAHKKLAAAKKPKQPSEKLIIVNAPVFQVILKDVPDLLVYDLVILRY